MHCPGGGATGIVEAMSATATSITGGRRRTDGPAVRFSDVSKSYGQVKAVQRLDLSLYPGETVALLGPNGAGKSTTLDLLLGLRNADSGTVEVFGMTPARAIS